MGTKDFNALDIFIANMRLGRVMPYVTDGSRVLDFGCGSQAMLLRSIQHKIKKGIGIDYDADPEKISDNIEIQRVRFTDKLPYKDNSFDTIFMLAVIEHIPLEIIDPLFAEFKRVLAPGGKIVYTTPTPKGKPLLEFLAFNLKIISAAEIADHKKYYNKADMKALARKHTLDLERYQLFQLGMNSMTVLQKKV